MKTVIIIPTYNERENIGPIIEALQAQFARMSHDMHILVVDDNSPDGTAAMVRESQQRYPNVHLIMGQKAGLGVAYIRGMNHAMDQLGADVVFEMDADFSHKPEDVPRLMAEIDRGADFVIGSRYVPGGTIPKEWGTRRKLNSWGGNMVARYIAGIPRIRDCTAGFRAIRTTLLRCIDFTKLGVQGYGFQVALLHAAVVEKGKVVEIPVDFMDRTHGESKLGLRDILEFIINAWWIRFNSLKTFIKFLIVGASGVAVNLGFFTLFLWMGMNKFIASPIAIELSIISNFFLNNYWTFRWRKTKGRVRHKGLMFNAVSLVALGVSYTTFIALSIAFPDLPPQFNQFIGIIPATLVNYFLNSYWTFKSVEDEGPERTSASINNSSRCLSDIPFAVASAYPQNPGTVVADAAGCADENKALPLTRRQNVIVAACFLVLAIIFHAPHFVFFKSETTIDFYLHYNWTKEFIESLKLGDPYPRWVYHASFGLGEPAFLFYSPLYYWVVGFFSFFGGTTWLSMHVAEVVSSTLLAWFVFRAMALYVRLPLAMIAGILALYNPFYVMLQYKFHGFPWAFAFAAHGLLLWSLLRPRAEHHFINVWAAIAIALATLSHTVSALVVLICFSILGVARPLSRNRGSAWFDARSIAGWLATVSLGLALSAMYLLPALSSMKFINSAVMTHSYVPWSAFSFPVFTHNNGFFWFTFQWPVSLWAALTIFVPLAYILKRSRIDADLSCLTLISHPSASMTMKLRTDSMHDKAALPTSGMENHLDRTFRATCLLSGVGIVALFFASELSYPFWILETPLRKVQFPFRFISIAAIAGILLVCLTHELSGHFRQRMWQYALSSLLLMSGIASSALFVKASYLDGHALPVAIHDDQYTFTEFKNAFLVSGFTGKCPQGDERCAYVRRSAESFLGLPEYALATLGPDWLQFARSGFAGECAGKGRHCRELPRTREGRHWQIESGEAATLRLPQYDFPAWEVQIDNIAVEHLTDPSTGAIMLNLPEGSHTVSVVWRRLMTEWLGLLVSSCAMLVLLVVLVRRRTRAELA